MVEQGVGRMLLAGKKHEQRFRLVSEFKDSVLFGGAEKRVMGRVAGPDQGNTISKVSSSFEIV